MRSVEERRVHEERDRAEHRVRRRDLLSAAGVATAAAALPAEALATSEASEDEAIGDPTRLSYSETEHIRWFYRRARM